MTNYLINQTTANVSQQEVTAFWDTMIASLMYRSLIKPALSSGHPLNRHQRFMLDYFYELYTLALGYTVRREWAKEYVPNTGGQSNTTVKHIKFESEPLHALLQLCYKCQSEYSSDYKSAVPFFEEVTIEYLQPVVEGVLELSESPIGSKSKILSDFRQQYIALLKDVNPTNPHDPIEQPHMYRLIAASLRKKDGQDEFRKHFWRPFIQSLTKLVGTAERSKHYGAYYIDGDTIKIPEKGFGKSGRAIFEVPKKYVMKYSQPPKANNAFRIAAFRTLT